MGKRTRPNAVGLRLAALPTAAQEAPRVPHSKQGTKPVMPWKFGQKPAVARQVGGAFFTAVGTG